MEEIAEDLLKGLEFLKDDKFNDKAFDDLTKLAFAILLGESAESAIAGIWLYGCDSQTESKELSSVDPTTLKQSYSALVTLASQFAKLNADSEQVKYEFMQSTINPTKGVSQRKYGF